MSGSLAVLQVVGSAAFLLTATGPLGDWYVDASNPSCPGSGTPSDPFCQIAAAVVVAADGDTIRIAPGTYLEHLDLDEDLRLIGTAGRDLTLIDAQGQDIVVRVLNQSEVTLNGLTLTGGSLPAITDMGAGLFVDSGCTVVVDDCFITSNRADPYGNIFLTVVQGGGVAVAPGASLTLLSSEVSSNVAFAHEELKLTYHAEGAGVFVSGGTVTLVNSTVSANQAIAQSGYDGYGFIGAHGGGIHCEGGGTVNLIDTVVCNNLASADADDGRPFFVDSEGGGLSLDGANATLLRSSLTGNTAGNNVAPYGTSARGGGIHAYRSSFAATQCTIDGNVAGSSDNEAEGGGVYLNRSAATLKNTTVSGNDTEDYRGTYDYGGGLAAVWSSSCTLESCTVAGNTSSGAGGIRDKASTIQVSNTIVADNQALDGRHDCWGTLVSQGYNLIETVYGCTLTGDLTGVQTGVDPKLGPLQDHGGATLTHDLLDGSPALDAGNPAAGQFPVRDQRAAARPADGDCDGTARTDLGAMEGNAPFWWSYGAGWPGTLGVPTLTVSAPPVLGTQITVDLTNSAGVPTLCWFLAGVLRTSLPTAKGGTLLVVPLRIQAFPLPASGLSVPFSVSDPAWCGLDVYVQALEADPGASAGASFTPGLAMTIGS